MISSLGSTRSSVNWAEMPGNWDRLNTRALFPSGNAWGIPDLPVAAVEVPATLIPYSDRHACESPKPGSAVHFFLDDYRFETVWTKPERGLSRCARVGAALTPDFSLWTSMPRAMQLWQTYRARWCGAWMLYHGIRVIPSISWAGQDSHDFAFAGVARGSMVAVSTVGVLRDPEARRLFVSGYAAMLSAVEPSAVLVYGTNRAASQLSLPKAEVPVTYYETRWKRN